MILRLNNKAKNTLQSAIQDLRNNTDSEKIIILESGDYYVKETIQLNPLDSGLQIKAEGKVRILGGRPITNWYKKDEKCWAAPLDEVKQYSWDFRMLMVNNRFAERARYPEQAYLLHESDFDVTWLSTYEGGFERKPSYEELTTLKYKIEDIGEEFEPENAEITVYHMWDESLVGVKSINRENSTIRFTNPSGWPPGAFTKNYNFEKRYVIWNTKEGLLNPGQWYLDRANGELVYWPIEGEDMENLEIIAPVIERIFRIEGDEREAVSDICLQGLTISVANAPLMSGAFGAKLFDGAISMEHVRNCHILDLEIQNVGAHAIKVNGEGIHIENCKLYNTGAGAIRLVGSDALIRNNHIHHVGRTFPSAIALYVGATDPNVPGEWEPGQAYKDCIIEYNELHDVPYAAICAGGKNLKIQKNLIYRAMQDLYDGAGIYITFCTNALVKNNFIKDIKDAPGAGTSAYYLDEKSIDCLVEENMEINVPRPSHNHISKNNTFRNNFFIIEGKGRFSMERSEGYVFENNVVIARDGFEIYDLKFCPALRNNIFYTPKGKIFTKDLDQYTVLKEYELELKDGNLNVDPLLKSFKDGIIEFMEGSPALKLGIKPIDVSDAGLIKG